MAPLAMFKLSLAWLGLVHFGGRKGISEQQLHIKQTQIHILVILVFNRQICKYMRVTSLIKPDLIRNKGLFVCIFIYLTTTYG